MKYSLVLLFLIFGTALYGQTDSIEKAILFNKLLSKELSQTEFSKIAVKWNQTIVQIKNYPELPFDKNGKVHYSFTNNFIGNTKDKLFTRTLEWLAINYGLLPSNIYSNMEDGKIIFRNSLILNTIHSCNYTSVISIKNEKILIEIINLGYQAYYEGRYSSDAWTPDKTVNFNISQLYPVILKNPLQWKTNLNLLISTDELMKTEKENLYDYITTFDYSQNF